MDKKDEFTKSVTVPQTPKTWKEETGIEHTANEAKGGTTRNVFDLGNAVAKVAKNPKGLLQNKQESKNIPSTTKELARGRDFVVTTKAQRNDKVLHQFLKSLHKFSESDFEKKKPKLVKEMKALGLGHFLKEKLLWNDFTSKRNWGIDATGKPVLLDKGALTDKVFSDSKDPKSVVDEYDKIKEARKQSFVNSMVTDQGGNKDLNAKGATPAVGTQAQPITPKTSFDKSITNESQAGLSDTKLSQIEDRIKAIKPDASIYGVKPRVDTASGFITTDGTFNAVNTGHETSLGDMGRGEKGLEDYLNAGGIRTFVNGEGGDINIEIHKTPTPQQMKIIQSLPDDRKYYFDIGDTTLKGSEKIGTTKADFLKALKDKLGE